MTDVGNCRPPPPTPSAVAVGTSPILMSANGVVGQSTSSTSFNNLQPTNLNGITQNYTTTTAATINSTNSVPGPVANLNNATNDQQHGKQQTAFIVLPISFRSMAGEGAGLLPHSQQNQQNLLVSTPNSNINNNLGSVLTPPPSTKMTIGHQQQQQQTQIDSPSYKQPISSDQAVKTAVNWIVHDAKNQRLNQQQQQPILSPHPQIYHRNNGKIVQPPLASPAGIPIKRTIDGNSRKFSTSTTQNEVSKCYFYLRMSIWQLSNF
jgi:hypothetical protein